MGELNKMLGERYMTDSKEFYENIEKAFSYKKPDHLEIRKMGCYGSYRHGHHERITLINKELTEKNQFEMEHHEKDDEIKFILDGKEIFTANDKNEVAGRKQNPCLFIDYIRNIPGLLTLQGGFDCKEQLQVIASIFPVIETRLLFVACSRSIDYYIEIHFPGEIPIEVKKQNLKNYLRNRWRVT